MDFQDKLALITGGSSGIGLACAKMLASQGAHVFILARRPEQLHLAFQEIGASRQKPSQRVGVIEADISDHAGVGRSLQRFVEAEGAPDIVILSAGETMPGLFETLDMEVFRRLNEINYFGTIHVIKALLPGMLERGRGVIAIVSSMAAVVPAYGYSAYGPTKAALRNLADTLHQELKPRGIHVCAVFPPDTRTPQLEFETPYKPAITKELAKISGVLSPETVAASILQGIKKRRNMIVPGSEARLLYFLSSLLGPLVLPVMDLLIAYFNTKIKRSTPDC